MAKPEKRKISRSDDAGDDTTERFASGRVTRSKSVPAPSPRYTPPADRSYELPSPTWVPVLMFTLLALGIVVIILNYIELLPGAVHNGYLLAGLGLILGGIITATQYR